MANTTFHGITLPGCAPAYAPEVAPEFDTGTSYAVGDYCTYYGNLYRCIVAHASASWNAGHFEQTNITNEIKSASESESLFERGTGSYSIKSVSPALHSNDASGSCSLAIGTDSIASGPGSFAFGAKS